MTTKQDENTQIPLTRRLKFKLLKGKSGNVSNPRALGLAVMRDPSKQQIMRRQLCTLVIKRKKRRKNSR